MFHATHGHFARRAIQLLVTSIALTAALPAHAQVPGTDCGCTATGDYVAPDPGVEPAAGSISPSGKYHVEVTSLPAVLPFTIDVVRADGVTLLSNVIAHEFGWSPDDDRFYATFFSGTAPDLQFEYSLYDLAAGSASASAPRIWHAGPTAVSSLRLRFSSDGSVFLFALHTAAFGTSLDLLEIAPGSLYQTSFLPASPPTYLEEDTDPSVSGWGFGPDPTRFVYGYVSDDAARPIVRRRMIRAETVALTPARWAVPILRRASARDANGRGRAGSRRDSSRSRTYRAA